VFWLYSLAVDEAVCGCGRDELIRRLLVHGVETRPLFYPLHQMPPYRQFAAGRPYPNSTWLSERGISLPSAPAMDAGDVDYVVGALKHALALGAPAR
jgi:perosamine synthetase